MSKAQIRKLQRSVQLDKYTPQADPEEVSALMDLLFEATKCNNAHCARLMAVDTRTWKRWTKEPPTAWFYPLILREAIRHTLASIVAQRRFTGKKFQSNIQARMNKIPRSEKFIEEISHMAYDIRGAELHLRTLLAKKGMWWSDIQLPANSGGYSRQSLRKAARALHLVMTQSGYGEDKDSFWRLPTEEEGDED